ncbi:sporulation protein [Tumebacillus sp. DT12]|uniref:Sporulation protein n=1 Tax=Tumebacillus lacus TaxID=2995335 RepID=A0ABT3X4P6_9BACL|nr:sporulation protein [Tumebacillus lacus]MCX7569704.1 sporulation protein [Tumebacillus lacus]
MFKKFMAKIGVGSAQIDFQLNGNQYRLGDTVEGQFQIVGGNVEQSINGITLDLNLKMKYEDSAIYPVIASIPVSGAFDLPPGERKTLDVRFTLPENLPVSRRHASYYFSTNLDIEEGLDSGDRDAITLLPSPRFAAVLDAIADMGFREKHDSGEFNGYNQEFAYAVPEDYYSRLNELEFEAAVEADGVRLLMELDLPTLLGFSEIEVKREVFLSNEVLTDRAQVASHLRRAIEETLANPRSYGGKRHLPSAFRR